MNVNDIELTEKQIIELTRIRGGCSCHTNPPCSNCSDPLTEEEAIKLGLLNLLNSEAYTEYMKMADNLFNHLKNGTTETPEEAKKTEERQNILWERMSDVERMYADEQILRTTLWIKT